MERSLGMVGVVKSYLQVGELVRSTEASGGMGRGMVAGLHMVRPNGVELTTDAVTLARDLVRFGVVFNDVHDNLEFAQSKGGKFESD